jgi:hypothetical protein
VNRSTLPLTGQMRTNEGSAIVIRVPECVSGTGALFRNLKRVCVELCGGVLLSAKYHIREELCLDVLQSTLEALLMPVSVCVATLHKAAIR